jgi:hypothetical protein
MYELRCVDGRFFPTVELDTYKHTELEQEFLGTVCENLDNLRELLRVEVFDRPTWTVPELIAEFVSELEDLEEAEPVCTDSVDFSEVSIFHSKYEYQAYQKLLRKIRRGFTAGESDIRGVFTEQDVADYLVNLLADKEVSVRTLAIATVAAAIKFSPEHREVGLSTQNVSTIVKIPGLGTVAVGIADLFVEGIYKVEQGFSVPRIVEEYRTGDSTAAVRTLRKRKLAKEEELKRPETRKLLNQGLEVTSNFIGVYDKSYFWILEQPDAVKDSNRFFELISALKLASSWQDEVNAEQKLWQVLMNSSYELPEDVETVELRPVEAKSSILAAFTYEAMDSIRDIWVHGDGEPEEQLRKLFEAICPRYIDSVKFKRFFGMLPEADKELKFRHIQRISRGLDSFITWFYARIPKV